MRSQGRGVALRAQYQECHAGFVFCCENRWKTDGNTVLLCGEGRRESMDVPRSRRSLWHKGFWKSEVDDFVLEGIAFGSGDLVAHLAYFFF